jgi:2-polyprenyl-3-methyl-5-hydroxy-6-metoxy-1,4-benzoquinol methylase
MGLFVTPPLGILNDFAHRGEYLQFSSYSHYNYLRPGLIPRLKRGRFATALRFAKPYFQTGDALDFGCADGVLLPSLATHFKQVVGIDRHPDMLKVAHRLVASTPLTNVTLLNNGDLTFNQIKATLGRSFRVAFLLETLEHIGSRPNLYTSKADFLDGLFSLLDPDGVIIISVPRMVGVLFLAKYLVQRTFRIQTEDIPAREVLRLAFLRNASRLEPRWDGGHLGFNHLRLTETIRYRFDLKAYHGTATSIFYVIGQRPKS